MDDYAGIAIALTALVVIIYLIKYLFVGAALLFAWACEQGFIGAAAYFACWILLFPFMVVACVISGAIASWSA
jgi:hypothetical protein